MPPMIFSFFSFFNERPQPNKLHQDRVCSKRDDQNQSYYNFSTTRLDRRIDEYI